jgi:hypothetical protein
MAVMAKLTTIAIVLAGAGLVALAGAEETPRIDANANAKESLELRKGVLKKQDGYPHVRQVVSVRNTPAADGFQRGDRHRRGHGQQNRMPDQEGGVILR